MVETETSFAAPPGATWRAEPFRLFFPLGILFGWVGIGHWLLYALGLTATYSCSLHGLVQMQGFMMAFAVGFLLTAIPRRTSAPGPSALEMTAIAGALVTITAAALANRPLVQHVAYAALFALLLQFAVRRFVGRASGRRPPAAFVMIPMGVLHGLAGAAILAADSTVPIPAALATFGRLAIEQGVFLCFVLGVGALVLPLMDGAAPPPDVTWTPETRRLLLTYALGGLGIFASLALEATGWLRTGPTIRALVMALGLYRQAWGRPGKAGLHRWLARLAVWMLPFGLALSALWPAYRVPALHFAFIGGFSLLVFAVATHVVLGHLDLADLGLGWPPPLTFMAAMLILAMLARVTADWSDTYFAHLGWAAGTWIVGSAAWLAFLGPKLLRRAP